MVIRVRLLRHEPFAVAENKSSSSVWPRSNFGIYFIAQKFLQFRFSKPPRLNFWNALWGRKFLKETFVSLRNAYARTDA